MLVFISFLFEVEKRLSVKHSLEPLNPWPGMWDPIKQMGLKTNNKSPTRKSSLSESLVHQPTTEDSP